MEYHLHLDYIINTIQGETYNFINHFIEDTTMSDVLIQIV